MGQIDPFLIAIGAGSAYILWQCLISIARAANQWHSYRNAMADVQSGLVAPLDAFHRYLKSANRLPAFAQIGYLIGNIGLSFGAGAIVLAGVDAIDPGGQSGTSGAAAFMPYLHALLLFVLLILFAAAMAPILTAVCTVTWAVAPARRNLRGLPSSRRDLALQSTRDTLLGTSIHPLIWMVSLALIYFGVPLWGALLIGVLGQVLVTTLRAANQVAIIRWLFPSTPIEQTEWAALGQHIHAWAQLAGRPLRAIHVQRVAPYGSVDWSIAGLGKQTLFITDMFLSTSDWRQRDAFAGLMLGLGPSYRKKRILRLILDDTYLLVFAAAAGYFLYCLEQALLSLSSNVAGSSASIALGQYLLQLLLPALLVFLVSRVYGFLGRRLNRSDKAQMLDADRFSVELVGDPLALLAALYLVWNYPSGGLLDRLATDSKVQARVTALQQQLSVPGPFAPWAFRPIPTPLPILLGPYPVSVPLTPEIQAEQPAPVPSTRYPVSAPQMIGASPVGVQAVGAPPAMTSPKIEPIA